MGGLGNLIGGAIVLGSMVMMADMGTRAAGHISGQIVGMTNTHYHVKMHKNGKPPGHKHPKKKGEVVKVRKSAVKKARRT